LFAIELLGYHKVLQVFMICPDFNNSNMIGKLPNSTHNLKRKYGVSTSSKKCLHFSRTWINTNISLLWILWLCSTVNRDLLKNITRYYLLFFLNCWDKTVSIHKGKLGLFFTISLLFLLSFISFLFLLWTLENQSIIEVWYRSMIYYTLHVILLQNCRKGANIRTRR